MPLTKANNLNGKPLTRSEINSWLELLSVGPISRGNEPLIIPEDPNLRKINQLKSLIELWRKRGKDHMSRYDRMVVAQELRRLKEEVRINPLKPNPEYSQAKSWARKPPLSDPEPESDSEEC
jgi:hypothetical protein